MSEKSKGSYAFSTLKNKADELLRLERQAGLDAQAEQQLWKLAGLEDGMTVLDVGCGPGVVACSMAFHHPNATVIGVDQNTELLAHAVKNQTTCAINNVRFRQGDVFDLPLPSESVDFVLARLLFQHLQNPAQALASLLRVLKPGGKLCLIDVDDQFFVLQPAPALLTEFQDKAMQVQKGQGGNRTIGRDFYRLLKQTGFTDIKTFVHTITSDRCGMKTFLDVTLRFKIPKVSAQWPATDQLEKFQQELTSLEQNPEAWGAIGVFIGVGTKSASNC